VRLLATTVGCAASASYLGSHQSRELYAKLLHWPLRLVVFLKAFNPSVLQKQGPFFSTPETNSHPAAPTTFGLVVALTGELHRP